MKLPCPHSDECLLDYHAQGHARPSFTCHRAVRGEASCAYVDAAEAIRSALYYWDGQRLVGPEVGRLAAMLRILSQDGMWRE